VLAAALALAASAAWGVGDFLGGLRSRTLAALAVMGLSQPFGLVVLALAAGIRARGPEGAGVLWACPSAVFGTLGLAAFYRGMATGAITIVAPVAGAAAVVPVAYGLATGDRISALQTAGIAAALVGVVLASRERGPVRGVASGVGWALVAALGFGGYFVPMHAAGAVDPLWASLVFRLTSVPLVWTALCVLRPPLAPAWRHLPVLAAIGILDTGGNLLFAAASEHGLVSVVSVLGSLYPVGTVLLARLVLGERVARTQEAGVVLALAGVVLVSGG
jgi:drug/metabolite transporter (DMT)-like permease